jgi:threonine synthase
MSSSTSVVCAGCGWNAPPLHPRPFRCPNAGDDDVDHVLHRRLSGTPAIVDDPDPFIRYRHLTHAWHFAVQTGMTDDDFVALVRDIGVPFRTTPFDFQPSLGVWVKDETSNVGGSHKGRHLMGVMIWLRVAARIDPELRRRPLAIASCGNAALAAATVARAAGWAIEVFIPADANPCTVDALEDLGAYVTPCKRNYNGHGDPAYHRFREAVAAGALPFTCQGNENGLAIEGGETLGWEIVSQLRENGGGAIDRIVIQVGGGALASAVMAAFDDALDLGLIDRLPRFDTVQTDSMHPLKRAYERVAERGGIAYATRHRSQFMWPWESEPRSVAGGILDDETYDWAAVVRGMLATGGEPLLVSEEQLVQANRLAEGTGIPACPTGSAGLAGVLELRRRGAIANGESVAVLFTGHKR